MSFLKGRLYLENLFPPTHRDVPEWYWAHICKLSQGEMRLLPPQSSMNSFCFLLLYDFKYGSLDASNNQILFVLNIFLISFILSESKGLSIHPNKLEEGGGI